MANLIPPLLLLFLLRLLRRGLLLLAIIVGYTEEGTAPVVVHSLPL